MKYALYSIILILTCTSCHKDQSGSGSSTFRPEYFEFGYSGGFAGIRKTFVIKDGQLYPDDTTHIPLFKVKYDQAQTLIRDFPAYLRLHPDSNFGCLGCADELVISIKAREGGRVETWEIDTYTDALPPEIRAYTTQVYNMVEGL